jgi:hypothetical protein
LLIEFIEQTLVFAQVEILMICVVDSKRMYILIMRHCNRVGKAKEEGRKSENNAPSPRKKEQMRENYSNSAHRSTQRSKTGVWVNQSQT